LFENLKKVVKSTIGGLIKKTASRKWISTSGFIKKTASGNAISTGGFLRKLPVKITFSLAVPKQPPVEMTCSTGVTEKCQCK
jgi:hypothetical protein